MKKNPGDIDFESIYIAHFSKMKRFAKEYVLLEEDAENIVQDVFLELWEKREVLSMPINLMAFLFTAVKNRSIDYLRHKLVIKEATSKLQIEHQLLLKIKLQSLEAFNEDILSDNNLESIIQKAVDSLPDKCRQIFIKSRIEGKKQKEIATELNISINTIETQMGLAYKKLRFELKDYLPLLLFI